MKSEFKKFVGKLPRIVLAIIILPIVSILFVPIAWATTYYMPDDFPNLRSAVAGMEGGDTLIIRDGIYPGSNNVLWQFALPPSGTSDHFTRIRAEHDGKAIFPDGFLAMSNVADQHYVIYEGLTSRSSVTISGADHVKFLRCSFTMNVPELSNSNCFSIVGSSYILIEDCWAWNGNHYGFLAYQSDHIIFRRCVVRLDKVFCTHPMAGFSIYTTNHVLLQNCIAIDGDHDEYWSGYNERGPSFYVHHGSQDVIIDSCISINNKNYFAGGAPNSGFNVRNCVVWNTDSGVVTRNDQGLAGGYNVEHCTFGNIRNLGVEAWGGTVGTVHVSDSIFYNIGTALKNHELDGSDYNVLYNNGTNYQNCSSGIHDYSDSNSKEVDPLDGNLGNGRSGLKYLPRIEDGSDFDGTANDGNNRGATIIKRMGKTGTLWGEFGYDLLQDGTNGQADENLWPFPNENRIRQDMRSYYYDDPNDSLPPLSGSRGFCADGTGLYGGPITLTSYIWEYLGNPCPSDICGSGSGGSNNELPVASAGSDQTITDTDGNGNEPVTLDGSGSHDPDGTIVSYTWLENGNQVATGVNPTINLSVGTHIITLRVQDNAGATATDTVQITVNSPTDTTPPAITAVQSSGITTTTAIITWTTDEPADSKVKFGLTQTYGQEFSDQALVTSHQVTLTGLTPNTTYNYQVESTDSNSNTASSSNYSFTTNEQGSVVMHTLQDFEDGVLWQPGGSQDPTGNGRGWAFLSTGTGDKIEIDNIGADGTSHSLKITFASLNDTIYFRSDDKTRDHMPEAAGANRMSFYVRFPEGFPIQTQPFRYDTWQLGTFIHDPDDWNDTHRATSESDHGIHHYYHRFTIEKVGNGWVKYIINTHPDQANYSGSTVPADRGSEYFDNFGRFYFHFGPEAGGPDPGRPFTIWIDEIKFYHDDGSVEGQVHDGGQNDAGFDGEFIPDSVAPPATVRRINFQPAGRPIPDGFEADYGYVWDAGRESYERNRKVQIQSYFSLGQKE